ncbi:MAG: hypothetical protein IH591_05315 [Bacteroidales bacterium]|nr:hypothetical protein [Bacteroidales bacterium]
MKRVFSIFMVIMLAAIAATTFAGVVDDQPSPVGNWTVEAPYAPEGFQTSKLTVNFTDEKWMVEMNFEELGYKLNAERISFTEGVFKFGFYIEGEDVTISMKFNGDDKLEGAASTAGGEVPLTAFRIKPVQK